MTEPGRNSSCRGKERFDSARLAHAVIRRGESTHRPRDAYRCSHCGFYHIGSAIKRMRGADIKHQARLLRPDDDFDDLT